MRSGGMDDVIFAGTAQRPRATSPKSCSRRRMASAEELEITRRIERGAGSAYRINGRDVRAKDVALIFADAATGAHSPALVSQGRIAGVISAKPAERRMMLEEAAGIAGLHVRRRDAESKLKQTETNLARLDDLLTGLDTQITGAAPPGQAGRALHQAVGADRGLRGAPAARPLARCRRRRRSRARAGARRRKQGRARPSRRGRSAGGAAGPSPRR